MSPIALGALIAWPLLAVLLWSWLRGPRAAIATAMLGWMLLPQGGIVVPGPIDGSKMNIVCLSMLLALAAIEPRRILGIRWSWLDLPIAGVCVCSLLSSVDNGLGVYDGFAESLVRAVIWGVPWLVGRACFTSLADMRVLAWGVVLGGLAYVPLCLYEVRMSPQLHRMLYGFFPHAEFGQTRRFGGFRPTVFMEHGLMVGLWMCLATLAGLGMATLGRGRTLLGAPTSLLVAIQAVTAILCKSAGALALLGGGIGVLFGSRLLGSRLALAALAVFPAAFVAYRVADLPTGAFVGAVESVPGLSARTDSLEYRLFAEGLLLDHAMRRPLLGWGGHGRHRPVNDAGEQTTRTDSLWIITLGRNGLFGLAATYLALTVPLWIVARRVPRAALFSPQAAPLLIGAVLVSLFACDSLFNAMYSPVYVMAGGAVVATVLGLGRSRPDASRPTARVSKPRAARPELDAAMDTPGVTPRPVARTVGPADEPEDAGPTPQDAVPREVLVPTGRAPARDLDSLGVGLSRFAAGPSGDASARREDEW